MLLPYGVCMPRQLHQLLFCVVLVCGKQVPSLRLDFHQNTMMCPILHLCYLLPSHMNLPPWPPPAVVTLGIERFRAPEVLFCPFMIGKDMPGVHHMVHDTICACDPDLREAMCSNVMLSGGSSLFAG